MNVQPSGETREPRRGMFYTRRFSGLQVQVHRVYPWGCGHRVRFTYTEEPEQWREEGLSAFRRLFVKQEQQ